MLLPAITLIALIAGVQSQQRLFLNNPLITVTRTTTTSVTSTLIPTCFEIISTTACARKKKQLAFLVNPFDYYHGEVPQAVIPIQPSVAPQYRFFPSLPNAFYNIFAQPEQPVETKPAIYPSFQENTDSQARFFGSNIIKFTYSTSTKIIPTVGTKTQTLQVNCLATGQTKPSNTCIIRLNFPPVPAGYTLQQYCQSLADAAKAALSECKYASSRRRRQDGVDRTSRVIVGFTEKDGGDPISRQAVAANIGQYCGYKTSCTLPGGAKFALTDVQVPGFKDILDAGGSSSKYSSAA